MSSAKWWPFLLIPEHVKDKTKGIEVHVSVESKTEQIVPYPQNFLNQYMYP